MVHLVDGLNQGNWSLSVALVNLFLVSFILFHSKAGKNLATLKSLLMSFLRLRETFKILSGCTTFRRTRETARRRLLLQLLKK